jgi:hypothetical protein
MLYFHRNTGGSVSPKMLAHGRHRVRNLSGLRKPIDEFQGALSGGAKPGEIGLMNVDPPSENLLPSTRALLLADWDQPKATRDEDPEHPDVPWETWSP